MTETNLNLTRRKFIVASSAAIAAPILMNMAGMVPEAKGAEKNYNFIDKKTCDLVVLGGGGSGLVAAVRAAQLTGKKVIVLEKAASTGGGARSARTVRTFGSKWQAKRNLPDTTMEFANAVMDEVYWKLDPELVNNCLRGTGQFFDWVCEVGGNIEDKFTPGKYVASILESEPIGPQTVDQVDGKYFGGLIMSMLSEKCKTYGVEVLTKHPVVDVEVNNGKIVAAIAKSEKGYVRIACKACVLATGSWINNKEILKKYAPKFAAVMEDRNESRQVEGGHMDPNYTGDGIALAEKVGAFIDYDSFCLRLMGPLAHSNSKVFAGMAMSPYAITVNLNGKRFCSEPVLHMGIFDGGNILLEQPRAQTYHIFDENTLAASLEFQKCVKAGKCAAVKIVAVMGAPSSLPDTMEEIQNDLDQSMAKGGNSQFKADTLEELADKIGVNKKNFLETVKEYNENCKKGADLEVYKKKDYLVPINKPPYYALLGTLGTDGAFGGVLVNPDMQAYKPDRSLVEGLYVTGDFASGRHVNLGGLKRQVLNDISWAFSSGFLAGTNAGNYLKGA
jgi:fumarate reductase flavoprotein subunit